MYSFVWLLWSCVPNKGKYQNGSIKFLKDVQICCIFFLIFFLFKWIYCCNTVNHLLLHCPFVHDLWAFMICLVGTNWVMPNSVDAKLKSWDAVRGVRRYVKVWRAAPACLMWCIWREHNQCTFKGKELSLPNIKFLFLKTLRRGITVSYPFYVLLNGVFRVFMPLPLIQRLWTFLLLLFYSSFCIFFLF